MVKENFEIILRPSNLKHFFGQEKIKNRLKVFIFSAEKRCQSLDHCLFYGPPGLGKTTLANVISNELKSKIYSVSAPSIETPAEMIEIIAQINHKDILFIDEIHGLKREIEEILYSVMDDFTLNVSYKNCEKTKILSLKVPHFTIIGATTKPSLMTRPLRERFGIQFRFEYYTDDELKEIVKFNCEKMKIKVDDNIALEIAKRSRKTPRIVNNLIKRLVDYSIYYKIDNITYNNILTFFNFLGIDELGLNELDYEILHILFDKFNNKGASLENVADYLNENVNNIKEMNEPFLVSIGLIERTKVGRKVTELGQNVLNRKIVNK